MRTNEIDFRSRISIERWATLAFRTYFSGAITGAFHHLEIIINVHSHRLLYRHERPPERRALLYVRLDDLLDSVRARVLLSQQR